MTDYVRVSRKRIGDATPLGKHFVRLTFVGS